MFHHENANSNKLSSAKSRTIDLKHKGKEILNLLYNVFVKVLQKETIRLITKYLIKTNIFIPYI